ncbi:oxidoreductase [Streptomyces albidus (ex Kaewkla and Franco 2022)]|uniref:oxidoreductase n=1 Tax=Streptomyces albidus (ex Kaewkla and Franco 2022) TaxID=722709 RepID=UPI0015EEABC7|nr:oxidoreductase [Streptomyces albidus (ex Kaewkla and Franco 2022)]
MAWTARSIPDQSGRTAVVTGANSGIGFVAARELARRGARVVLACRSEERGAAAMDRLLAQVPEAQAELRMLDLADLSSVQRFAEALPYERVHLLLNNAGLMAVPYARTVDGFETQFGVNHLGHFALTGLLLDRLLAAPGARVVTVSSMAHAMSNIDINDLNSERRYRPMLAYAASKTANLLFVREFAHRADSKGLDLTVTAAHPGYTKTQLQVRGPQLAGSPVREGLARLSNGALGSSPDQGAAPVLFAATAPYVHGDSFFGPRIFGVRGGPGPSRRAPWARNDIAAGQLWAASERLTGVTYQAL